MGSTFGALHVRDGDVGRAIAWVSEELGSRGFVLEDDATPENDEQRRVLVFETGGWVVIADEDVEGDADGTGVLGRIASAQLDADVLAVSVAHSDIAVFERSRKGDQLDRFEVPSGAVRDEASGRAYVGTKFLADLAVSPSARLELEKGLLADHTFPEETVYRAAELVGLPAPGAGVRSLWRAPPDGAKKLRFRADADEPVPVPVFGLGFAHETGRPLDLSGPQRVAVCVGMPLHEQVTFTLRAQSGDRITGLVVELEGSALALLDVPEIAGWNPDIRPGGDTKIEVVSVVRGVAPFPTISVAPSAPAMPISMNAAGLRAFENALATQSKNQFFFHLRGKGQREGTGDLVVRIKDAAGRDLDVAELRVPVEVAPAPRMPILPWPGGDDPHEARRRVEAAKSYSGDRWLSGWVGFAQASESDRAFVLDAASALASQLSLATGELEVSITSAGAHPKELTRFVVGGRFCDWPIVVRHFDIEADVRVHVPYDRPAFDMSYVRFAHQPRGSTILDSETRDRFPEQRIVPLELSFSLARPDSEDARVAIGKVIAQIFDATAKRAACVGAFVAPTGAPLGGSETPYEELLGLNWRDELEELEKRPRSPGARVIVPRSLMTDANRGVQRTEVSAGVLLIVGGDDPFTLSDDAREAMERALLPAFRSS